MPPGSPGRELHARQAEAELHSGSSHADLRVQQWVSQQNSEQHSPLCESRPLLSSRTESAVED